MEKRIELFDSKYSGLAWAFQVSPSSCGNHEHYEQYIRLSAASDMAIGMGTTHVLLVTEGSDERMAGFITLKAASIVNESDGSIYGTPAIEIAELAVAEEYAGKGYGTELMDYAVSIICWISDNLVAVKHITLCSDPMSVGFYEKYGFQKLSSSSTIPTEGWNESCIPMYMTLPR